MNISADLPHKPCLFQLQRNASISIKACLLGFLFQSFFFISLCFSFRSPTICASSLISGSAVCQWQQSPVLCYHFHLPAVLQMNCSEGNSGRESGVILKASQLKVCTWTTLYMFVCLANYSEQTGWGWLSRRWKPSPTAWDLELLEINNRTRRS